MLVNTMRPECDDTQRKGLQWLCEYLKRHMECRCMFEIGSYAGESAEIFAKYFDRVWCVDTWNFAYVSEQHVMTSWKAVETSFDERSHAAGNIHKWKMTSTSAAEFVTDASLDFVYVDADHSYEAVKEDIRLWLPKVHKGGYIGGHDFSYYHPGVPKAVLEAFLLEISTGQKGEFPPSTIMLYPDSSWLVKKEN